MAFIWESRESKYWQAGWRDEKGKRRNKSTKIIRKSTTRRQAGKIADLFEETAKNKRTAKHIRSAVADLQKEITGEDAPIATFNEYAERFSERKRGETGKSTMTFYKTTIRDFSRWLGERAGDDMANVTRSDMDRYRNHLLEKVATTTATNKLKALRSIFREAHEQGFTLIEPTQGMKFSRKNKGGAGQSQKRAFTLDELKIILAEAGGEWRSMILFGLYTGQRLGDIASIRWQNLDLVRGEYRTQTRKTGRTVTIPLAAPLLDHLAEMDAPDDPTAFIHPQLAANYQEKGSSPLSHQFADILAACGLRAPVSHRSQDKGRDSERERTTLSFHCLRATAATLLHEAGIPAAIAQEWIGHDSEEVHKVYVKIGRESLQRATSALPDITGKGGVK